MHRTDCIGYIFKRGTFFLFAEQFYAPLSLKLSHKVNLLRNPPQKSEALLVFCEEFADFFQRAEKALIKHNFLTVHQQGTGVKSAQVFFHKDPAFFVNRGKKRKYPTR